MKKRPIIQKIMAANQVTISDWLAMKPYDIPVLNYDIFYLKQCQTVYGYCLPFYDVSEYDSRFFSEK